MKKKDKDKENSNMETTKSLYKYMGIEKELKRNFWVIYLYKK